MLCRCGPAARAPSVRRVVSGWIASRHVPCGRKDCARSRKDTVPSLRAFRPWPFIVNSDAASYSNGVSILITPWLDAFYSVKPDSTFPAQLVSFGTSGHRGSSLAASFNELHILAIAQAVVDYRLQAITAVLLNAQVMARLLVGLRCVQRRCIRFMLRALSAKRICSC